MIARALAACGLAAALALSGCTPGVDTGNSGNSGGNSGGSGQAAGDSGDTNGGGGQLHVITTGDHSLDMVGADAAEVLGLYEKEGLNVKVTVSENGAQALASGDADIAMGSPNRFIGAIQEGLDAKIVGPTVNAWLMYIIVRNDLGITDVKDWKGGRIGISSFGSAGHFSAQKLIENLGWKEGDYEIVPLGGLDGLMAGLKSGTIDGFFWSAEGAFELQRDGAATLLGTVGDYIGDIPLNVIAMSGDLVNNRPEEAKKFCTAFYDAQKQFQDDPKLTADTYQKWGMTTDTLPDVMAETLPVISTSPKLTDEMLANMAEATNFTIEGANVTPQDVKAMYVDCSTL